MTWRCCVYLVNIINHLYSRTQFCLSNRPRDLRAAHMLTMSQWMNVWKVFAKCMKSILRGWIQTVPPSLMTLVSCSTLLTTWQIWVVLCTGLTLKHTNHTTKTGSRRRYMSCCGVRLSRQQSKGVSEELSCYTHLEGVYAALYFHSILEVCV